MSDSDSSSSPPPLPPPGPLVWEIQAYHWTEAAQYLEKHPDEASTHASHNRGMWSFIMVRGENPGEYFEQIFYEGKLMVSREHFVKQKRD